MKKYVSGFTLIELMVTIAIMAIMATIAFPSMREFVENSRINNRAEQIANLFRFARSEAVRLNAPVIICGTNIRKDGRPDGECDGHNKVKINGLRAYADNNRDGQYDSKIDNELRVISINSDSNNPKVDVQFKAFSTNLKAAADPLEIIFMPNGAFGIKSYKDNIQNLQLSTHYISIQVSQHDNANRGRVIAVNPTGVVEMCSKKYKYPDICKLKKS